MEKVDTLPGHQAWSKSTLPMENRRVSGMARGATLRKVQHLCSIVAKNVHVHFIMRNASQTQSEEHSI